MTSWPDLFDMKMPHHQATHQMPKGVVQAADDLPAPVIVFGALRSGTTLLRLLMNAHPDLHNPGEVDFLTDHIRAAPDAPTGWRYDKAALRADRMFRAQGVDLPDALDGLDLMHALLAGLAAKSGGLLCVNLHRDLPLMIQLQPAAKVVHLLRDPRDVARSSVDMGWAGTLFYAADHWVETELDWDRVRPVLRPDDWTELHFEALMTAPETELRRLCCFLGVGYSDKMLTYPAHSTYRPLDPKVAQKWARLCPPREVAELESKIAPLMRPRGYAPSVPNTPLPGWFRRAQLGLHNKLGMWAFGARNYGAVPFFGARIASRLRLVRVQRFFQARIDRRIRQMLR